MINPDKYLRQAIHSRLSNLSVNGKVIEVFDTIAPDNYKHYIILSNQDKSDVIESKCGNVWECSILLDIVTVYQGVNGARAFAEDIMESVMNICEDLSVNNFVNLEQSFEFPSDIYTVTNTQTIIRKLIRYNVKLNRATND